MSFKKYFFLSLFSILTLLLSSCEDTKKNPIQTDSDKIETTDKKEVIKDNSKDSINTWQALTTETAADFFLEYGKSNPETLVKFETNFGDIHIKLYEDSPIHRANFVYLVKEGYFDLTTFHRIVKDFIIQGGSNDGAEVGRMRNKIGRHYLLPPEIHPTRVHKRGTVSGAKEYRENPGHQSNPYEFFIFVGEPINGRHLNGSYTIFGEVVKGLDVAVKISEEETDIGEWPIALIYVKASFLD